MHAVTKFLTIAIRVAAICENLTYQLFCGRKQAMARVECFLANVEHHRMKYWIPACFCTDCYEYTARTSASQIFDTGNLKRRGVPEGIGRLPKAKRRRTETQSTGEEMFRLSSCATVIVEFLIGADEIEDATLAQCNKAWRNLVDGPF